MSVPYALHAKTVETINVPGNNTISIPAFALAKSPTTAHISEASGGLRWGQNYVGGTSLTVKKPANYTGGDVEFTIFFRTLASTTTGEVRSEEHTSELQSRPHLVCRLLLEKKKIKVIYT